MRDFKGMKRQRGRNRGGGGKPQQHNANRAFESNGPDGVKARGNAQTVFEKYQQLARDAASSGDRVLAENYLQHAEHYFRTLRAMQPQRPAAEILGRDYQSSGFDLDFEAEPEEGAAEPEADATESSTEEGGEQRPREDRPRDRDRFEGRNRDRFENRDRQRDDRPRDDRPRDDRPREDRPPRDDRPRDDRPPREDRPQQQGEGGGRRDRWRDREDRRERFDRGEPRQDPLAVVEPQSTPLPAAAPAESSPVLRSASGDVSHAPAFLGRAAEPKPEAVADAPPKPKRTRKPKAPAAEEA